MDGYQMEFSASSTESFQDCPACGSEMVAGQTECFRCGVVVKRFQDRLHQATTKESVGGIDHLTAVDIQKLDKMWKMVMINYHDQTEHNNFMTQCQKRQALPFAVYHYSKMLEIDKEDDIALVMRKQALTLLTFKVEKTPTATVAVKSKANAFDRLVKGMVWVGALTSTFCIVLGATLPSARNLIGLGVAFLALILSLYFYRRS